MNHSEITQKGEVIIIDDDPFIREVTAEMVSIVGYSPRGFTDGNEAVQYYHEHWKNVCLAVIDLTMPKMSGAECVKRLKEVNIDVKVVLCTGHSYNPVSLKRELNLADNLSSFLQKPYDLASFEEKINEVVGGT